MKLNNKIVVVVPTWNTGGLIEECIESILNQDVDDLGLIIRDDLSDDGTYDKILDTIGRHSGLDGKENEYAEILWNNKKRNIIFIRNEEKYYPCGNIWDSVVNYVEDPEAIIVTVDADDSLIGTTVFSEIKKLYEIGDYWLVWTQHSDVNNQGCSQKLPPDEIIYQHRYYWCVSHLRTAKAFLYKNIKREDILDPFDGKGFPKFCGDAFLLFPLIEQSGNEKSYFYDKVCYKYNNNLPTNEHNKDVETQHSYSAAVKNYPKYKKLVR